ncbi:MAG: [FeFe] hydrogenase H-cluster radical SAM maturase HydE [Lentisphaerae bacterium]|nr:[FeFe] hydrogenase H-cluster radical SAM maturase HydE [Lentisphaerota bacterium]
MASTNSTYIDELRAHGRLSHQQWLVLLIAAQNNPAFAEEIRVCAHAIRERYFGRTVYIRGLIELSNYCRNDCFYCGIRKSNGEVSRYRLSLDEILGCCQVGYDLGFRTFVLQGGEDAWFNDDRLAELVAAIRTHHPDSAITLSLGERSRESYERLFAAGANRYLLRHEAVNPELYASLHPARQRLATRLDCLRNLQAIGFQTGAGFMVGAPGQTLAHIAEDMVFLGDFRPAMVGIGPFIPQHATRYAHEPAGSVDLTLILLSLIRIMLPNVLLPATTALGTMDPQGHAKGMRAGANVVMPNLSPADVRGKYLLYDNKMSFGSEAAEGLDTLRQRMAAAGYEVVVARGDQPPLQI